MAEPRALVGPVVLATGGTGGHVFPAEALAQALGAELAASRPICDAGWLPMDRQVGSDPARLRSWNEAA